MSITKKYKKAFMLSIQRSMEYRVSFFVSTLSAIFPIVMQYFLWTAMYGNSASSNLYGFTYNQMITYIVLSSIVSLIISTGFEWEVANDIKNGGLNAYIVKPIGYFPYKVSCFLGGKALQINILFVLILMIIFLLKTFLGVEFEIIRILLFMFVIILSLILNFLMFFSLSTIAFWVSEVWGMFSGFSVLINLFSGGLFPIDVFGKKIVMILNYMPFKYTIYFPINILNGSLTFNSILEGLLIQSVWIIALFFIAKFLWHLGTKKYVSIGG